MIFFLKLKSCIKKRCLNSGQIDVISMELFGLNPRTWGGLTWRSVMLKWRPTVSLNVLILPILLIHHGERIQSQHLSIEISHSLKKYRQQKYRCWSTEPVANIISSFVCCAVLENQPGSHEDFSVCKQPTDVISMEFSAWIADASLGGLMLRGWFNLPVTTEKYTSWGVRCFRCKRIVMRWLYSQASSRVGYFICPYCWKSFPFTSCSQLASSFRH